MAKEANTRVRRRERKNIASGVAHVNSTFNNTMITITDAQGNAYFPNVLPGYFTIKLFADYGNPVTQTLTDSSTGASGSSCARTGPAASVPAQAAASATTGMASAAR
mgnify:CR=1 FL=1